MRKIEEDGRISGLKRRKMAEFGDGTRRRGSCLGVTGSVSTVFLYIGGVFVLCIVRQCIYQLFSDRLFEYAFRSV